MLLEEHIEKVMQLLNSKAYVPHVTVTIDNIRITENDYNLSVSSNVVLKDKREKIDIVKLNQEVSKTVKKINKLPADIDLIIKQI